MLKLTTSGVKIEVRTKYEEGISSPVLNSYVFSYEITIHNTNDFPIQLMRRFWDIFDSSGQCREVEGAGVVGEQPYIAPNATYTYSSACDLKSSRGKMSGYYTMKNHFTDQLFIVQVPDFQLEVPFVLN
jgi:ApaG protein